MLNDCAPMNKVQSLIWRINSIADRERRIL